MAKQKELQILGGKLKSYLRNLISLQEILIDQWRSSFCYVA